MNWQPIDTAPKDGTPILMALGNIVGSGRWRSQNPMVETWPDFFFDGASMPSGATHWMPLPLPPSSHNQHPNLELVGFFNKKIEDEYGYSEGFISAEHGYCPEGAVPVYSLAKTD